MAKSTVKLPKKTKVKPPTKTIKPSNGKTKRCKKRYTKKELEEFDKIIKDKIEELQEQIEYYESLTKIPVSELKGIRLEHSQRYNFEMERDISDS